MSLITSVTLLLLLLLHGIHSGNNSQRGKTSGGHYCDTQITLAVSLVDGQGSGAEETVARNMYKESYITAEEPLKLH